MENWKEIKPEDFNKSPFQTIGKDWMVVAAEKEGKVNMMTASWGGLGVMWGKNVAYVVIRPQRYTKQFIDSADGFSLTFYEENFRKDLNYLGTVSGRDEDKVQKTGFTVLHDGPVPYFEEANTALICRKLYAQEMKPECFIDTGADQKWYPNEDYHTLYIAEIIKTLVK